ncbi:hypothetical protein B0A78_12930 [Flavobacterium columnare NBRC 100251 = ATCC 23463]|uniref:hypothetical protein n=1 Tax=Flavobacterium columnare TaxID=996 RepID=UPI0009813CC0|nr:hypothetical protein [Flavobacterium columnare]OOB82330.1 hypothetical protein BZL53_11000 [Flavobacterium columnare]PDS22100.1 hypothetical protein B0A78_12930 [Flavobacterium columnare NBRC 100251 = ATCC 23463]QOG89764.1 hypothetical protein HUE41_06895 [Flavobacterium columnare]QOG92420.1 hypothetical protein HUE42_06890 [Flavobacterium columnare]QOG95085.1 hypothetical protein HUE43_06895 [Flavobacterium columnare]
MENTKTIAFRTHNSTIKVKINNIEYLIETELDNLSNYNIKLIFNLNDQIFFYDEKIFGEKKIEKRHLFRGAINNLSILDYSQDSLVQFHENVNVDYSVYVDYPINQYEILNAIPLPTNILTIVLNFNKTQSNQNSLNHNVYKYFDAFSHLGFCLVDLEKMKTIIDENYSHRKLDLIHEFTNTDLIEKLFAEGIIIITWGINPFSYPIYSIENKNIIANDFGMTYDDNKGVYNIKEEIEDLSIIPGNLLKNWEDICSKQWEKIPLYGKGQKVILEPRKLIDLNDDIIISSFLLYRTDDEINENVLLNIDLLY